MRFSISFHVTRQVCMYLLQKKSKQPDEVLSIYLFHFWHLLEEKKTILHI